MIVVWLNTVKFYNAISSLTITGRLTFCEWIWNQRVDTAELCIRPVDLDKHHKMRGQISPARNSAGFRLSLGQAKFAQKLSFKCNKLKLLLAGWSMSYLMICTGCLVLYFKWHLVTVLYELSENIKNKSFEVLSTSVELTRIRSKWSKSWKIKNPSCPDFRNMYITCLHSGR